VLLTGLLSLDTALLLTIATSRHALRVGATVSYLHRLCVFQPHA
jgi:hypothetical protein